MFGEFENDKLQQLANNFEENYDLPLRDRIVNCIAKKTEVILRSQQKHEPDFTYEERVDICLEILLKDAAQFLFRFGKHLQREHLQYFICLPPTPDLNFYINETQKLLNNSTRRVESRNRRFAHLRNLEASGSGFFSEAEMGKRDPLLYKELVTDNLTQEEKLARAASTEKTNSRNDNLSDFIFEQMDRNEAEDFLNDQQKREEDCFEEEEDDDEEMGLERRPVSKEEQELLRKEFESEMHSRFVSGKDNEFDYSEIDDKTGEDEFLLWKTRDEEEKYFEEEEDPEEVPEDGDHGSNLGEDSLIKSVQKASLEDRENGLEVEMELKEDNH